MPSRPHVGISKIKCLGPQVNLCQHGNGKRVHVKAAGKHWHATRDICMLPSSTGVLIRSLLPELDMQVSAEIELKHFLASTEMA